MRYIDFFFFKFGSVGIDGAQTHSFRLDRVVLWPIELQFGGGKMYWIPIFIISFKLFHLYLDKYRRWNRDVSEILLYTRIYTSVRAARIPFVIVKSIHNSFFNVPNEKKKTFFSLLYSFHYILCFSISWSIYESRSLLARS